MSLLVDSLQGLPAGFPGTGTGAFLPRIDTAVGPHPTGVAVADFDRDGIPDVVVSSEYGGYVSVLLGNHCKSTGAG